MNRTDSKLAGLGDGRDLVAAAITQQLAERAAYMEATAELLQEMTASFDRQLARVSSAVQGLLAAVERRNLAADARTSVLQASAAPGKSVEFIRDEAGRLTAMREVPMPRTPDGSMTVRAYDEQLAELFKDLDLGDAANGNGAV